MYENYEEILTVSELADYLKVGMNTAYNLVKYEEITSFKVGNSYRIHRSAISDYIISKGTKGRK